ncbi:MAG TPA: type II toxin-antitoxin system RelE/ParE family toxin [Nitrospiraceae bacterium]|jgi:mRNA interferase RelE/StbE
MAWYRIAFRPAVLQDLVHVETAMAQRLFDKTKWIASNAENLRHESLTEELHGLCKYAVGDWRIFYSIDRNDHCVDIHGIIQKKDLRA